MYKTLLVHLDEHDSCAARVSVAIEFARVREAHLIGHYPLNEIFSPMYSEIPLPADIYDMQYQNALAVAETNRKWFTEQLIQAGCSGEWIRGEEFGADSQISRAACNADLVVVSQRLDGDPLAGEAGFVGRVVVHAPAPILMIPEQGVGASANIGQRILIAWSDSREAARAVSDALPLLTQAEYVVATTVVSSQPDPSESAARSDELQRYLALHGINAELDVCEGHHGETGAKLLGRAAAADCDLIVAGGYGHGRLREMVFGGVTRHLLAHTTMPLFMSH